MLDGLVTATDCQGRFLKRLLLALFGGWKGGDGLVATQPMQ